jgi:GAF domain-containing protein
MRHDTSRLAALKRALILDTAPEKAYDDITRLLATALEVPITLVNLLDAHRDWFKSRVGEWKTQAPEVLSFCEAFFDSTADVIVVEDTLLDARFQTHPLVVGPPFIRFYAAARLTREGYTLGTLCAYDVQPRQLSATQLQAVQTMATAVMELIDRRSASA